MRDKHLHIKEDLDLLRQIRHEVDEKLLKDKTQFVVIMTLKFMLYFGLGAFFYSQVMLLESTTLFLLSYIAMGMALLLLAFNFAHDLSHDALFKQRRWNHFAYTVIYTIVGAHAEAWKERHVNSHHFSPNVKDYDTDLQITSLIRVIPGSQYQFFHRFQFIYAPIAYTSYSLFWIFVKDFVIYSQHLRKGEKTFIYHLSFWIQKMVYVGYILICPILFSQQSTWMVLIGFISMHMVLSLFLLFTFFMTHHVESTLYPETKDGIIQSSWAMNQILSSNDMHPFSPVANFILGGFNNHIAHHLFPHIPHYFYPQLSQILYGVLKENQIFPNHTSYWGGVVSHMRILKHLGEKA